MAIIHQELSNWRWNELSFAEKMWNIWSEVSRALRAKENNNQARLDWALDRMLELFDLTLNKNLTFSQLKEVARLRESICEYFFGENLYWLDSAFLDKYFYYFWILARKRMQR